MRQGSVANLQGQVDMVGHEAEGVDTIAESAGSLLEQEIEAVTVLWGKKNRLAAIATKNDMIESAGNMNSRFACHAGNIPTLRNLSTWKPDPDPGLIAARVAKVK